MKIVTVLKQHDMYHQMNSKKAIYVRPETTVINIDSENNMLAGSGGADSPLPPGGSNEGNFAKENFYYESDKSWTRQNNQWGD